MEYAAYAKVWTMFSPDPILTPIPCPTDCIAAEEGWRAQLVAEYNQRSRDVTHRTETANDDGNIAVRRRILNRQINARHGQLYARFSGAIQDRKTLAAATIRACLDSLAATQEAVAKTLPNTPESIRAQYEALEVRYVLFGALISR
jgi:hypothetical protein